MECGEMLIGLLAVVDGFYIYAMLGAHSEHGIYIESNSVNYATEL